jgi:DNA-binding HxlR family transcriptional regulator
MNDAETPRMPQGETSQGETSDSEMIAGTRAVLDLLDGKWTVEVLYLLAKGKRRYSEVFYEVGEISKKMLTRTLRQLEANGLVMRTIYPEVPPRVEYSLTRRGWSITEPLMRMYEWAAEHLGESDVTSLTTRDGRRGEIAYSEPLAA